MSRLVNGMLSVDSCTRSLLMTWRSIVLKTSYVITSPFHDAWLCFWISDSAPCMFMILTPVMIPLILIFYMVYLAVQLMLWLVFLVTVIPTSILIWTLILLHITQTRYRQIYIGIKVSIAIFNLQYFIWCSFYGYCLFL